MEKIDLSKPEFKLGTFVSLVTVILPEVDSCICTLFVSASPVTSVIELAWSMSIPTKLPSES